jgi:membrane fusion protein (multidrug efflux system)
LAGLPDKSVALHLPEPGSGGERPASASADGQPGSSPAEGVSTPHSRLPWRARLEFLWRAAIGLVAVVFLLIIVTRWQAWQGAPGWQVTDDAYLQADQTLIAAKVSGYLAEVPVQDYQRVRAGQVIAQVYDLDYRASVSQAQAQLAEASAQVETVKAQIDVQRASVEAARAVVASTRAALVQNTRDLARQESLLATGSSTAEAHEKLDTTRLQLDAQLGQNRAEADGAARQLAVLAAQEQQAQATAAAARAALALAQINLGYTRIVAPEDGVIAQRQVKPGQYVGVGTQITSLIPLPHVWVIANYKETQLTHMAAGERAEIRIDAYLGHVLKGHVVGFAPGSGAQFALLPPDNATGNFTKVVQRVAVKIVIDDAAGLADRLRPGLSAVTRVDAQAADRR